MGDGSEVTAGMTNHGAITEGSAYGTPRPDAKPSDPSAQRGRRCPPALAWSPLQRDPSSLLPHARPMTPSRPMTTQNAVVDPRCPERSSTRTSPGTGTRPTARTANTNPPATMDAGSSCPRRTSAAHSPSPMATSAAPASTWAHHAGMATASCARHTTAYAIQTASATRPAPARTPSRQARLVGTHWTVPAAGWSNAKHAAAASRAAPSHAVTEPGPAGQTAASRPRTTSAAALAPSTGRHPTARSSAASAERVTTAGSTVRSDLADP